MERRIQVAFQGGGARIIHLLAAVDALQDFEQKRQVKITRASGTSAGSIAATILAANVEAATFTNSFIARSEETLTKLRNSDPVHLTILDGISAPRQRWLPAFVNDLAWDYAKRKTKEILERNYSDLLRILDNQPLFNSRVLASELRYLVESSPRKRDLGSKELIIMTSNLLDAKAHPFVFNNFDGNEAHIYQAVVDSCAIPFAFRTPRDLNTTALVDGGLCENLPSDVLYESMSDPSDHGEVVAICFKEEARFDVATDFQSYLSLLFDTSINNSMVRAKSRLKPDAIHEIRPSLSTLGFAQMAKHGPGSDSYELIKLRTQIWLDQYLSAFINTDKVIYHIPARKQPLAAEITEKIGKIFGAQHRFDEYEIEKYRLVVLGYSLTPVVRSSYRSLESPTQNDRIRTEVECVFRSERFYCMEISFEGAGNESSGQAPVQVKAMNPDGTEIPIVVLTGRTARRIKGAFTWKQIGLIFFTPPLERGHGEERHFKVRTDQRQLVLDEAPNGWDVAVVASVTKVISSAEIVIFLPPGVGTWTPSCLRNFGDTVGVEGQILEPAELSAYDPYDPGGWSGYGLKAGRLEGGKGAILKISRIP